MLQITLDSQGDEPIYQQIAAQIRTALSEGVLKQGQKLPSISALARDLGISPLTVGRGYEHLAQQGLVVQRHGSGTYIQAGLSRDHVNAGRPVRRMFIIIGEPSLAALPRSTSFITADILAGLQKMHPQPQTQYHILKSFGDIHQEELTSDDAIVFRHIDKHDSRMISPLLDRQIRALSIWGQRHDISQIPNVSIEVRAGASMLMKHLIESGYKRIGFIGRSKVVTFPFLWKFEQYCSDVLNAGLDIRATHVRYANTFPGSAYQALRDMLGQGDMPDAIFVDTDYKAMEVITALGEAGIRVPQDIAVVGYDNVPEAALFSPTLTTVDTHRFDVGVKAGELLLNWQKDQPIPENVTVSSELIVRQSCPALPESTSRTTARGKRNRASKTRLQSTGRGRSRRPQVVTA